MTRPRRLVPGLPLFSCGDDDDLDGPPARAVIIRRTRTDRVSGFITLRRPHVGVVLAKDGTEAATLAEHFNASIEDELNDDGDTMRADADRFRAIRALALVDQRAALDLLLEEADHHSERVRARTVTWDMLMAPPKGGKRHV